jgi:hypothetical protein
MTSTTANGESPPAKNITYFKGSNRLISIDLTNPDQKNLASAMKGDLLDAMNSKYLGFLFGSGTSSQRNAEGVELGVPTMVPMASQLFSNDSSTHLDQGEIDLFQTTFDIKLNDDRYRTNLEYLMETLFGVRFILQRSGMTDNQDRLHFVDGLIAKVSTHIKELCLTGAFSSGDNTVLNTYTQFYRRLVQRDHSLPRPWVFTTNYDLFSETAMDRAGIPYLNGFMGSIERRFNPAVFRYALSQQMDLASRKWSTVDSLVYFCKLHGSISWESRGEGMFPVVETNPELIANEQLLIYPTPAKQGASFVSPYSDMFREFQTRVAREQSVLISIGYSFGDEHVNNILFQALTIPTFRLIIFADTRNEVVNRLLQLEDPRVWVLCTEDRGAAWKGHYFSSFVDLFMATEGDDPADLAVEKVLIDLLGRGTPPSVTPSDE